MLNHVAIPHNKALQLTANPLRGLSAAELGRYVYARPTDYFDRIGKTTEIYHGNS